MEPAPVQVQYCSECGQPWPPEELARFGDRLIANPGAVLRDPAPGADNPPATGTFGVLELPERRWRVFRASNGCEVDILRAP